MRFRKLTLSGFGPFLQAETINFERLGSAGLFLLAGPTGAGKTTLLDAICYALFGQTTGEGQTQAAATDGRSGEELRCTRATPADKTEVELEFTVSGRDYKMIRNPAYERAALKGGGTTKAPANATLFQWSPGEDGSPAAWKPKATKIREVAEAIHAITGFTADQFRRVIVIPQGRFRDVLASSVDAREDLLKRIFGTEVFERFEAIVARDRTAAQAEYELVRRERERLLAREEWTVGLDETAVAAGLALRKEAALAAAAESRRAFDEVAARYDASNRALGEAQEVGKLHASVIEARQRKTRAEQQLEHVAPDRERLAAARTAAEPARLRAVWREVERRQQEAAAKVTVLEQQAEAASAAVVAQTGVRDEATTRHAKTAEIDTRLGVISEQLKAAESVRKRHAEAQAEATAAEAAVTRATEAAEAASRAETLARDALNAAETELHEARRRYEVGTASRLAARLEEGLPCAVCGSTTHPSPAQSSGDVPSDAAVKKLVKHQGDMQARRDEAIAAATQATATLMGATATAASARAVVAATPAPPDAAALETEQAALTSLRRKLVAALTVAQAALDEAIVAAGDMGRALAAEQSAATLLDGQAAEAQRVFAEQLATSGFGTAEAVAAAARDADTIARIAATIDAADQEAALASEALTTATIALGDRTPPDIARLKAAHQTLSEAQRVAREADEAARRRAEECGSLEAGHACVAAAWATAEQAHRARLHLHQMVSGQAHAEEKISLHRWVLGAVLEQVVAEATVLLRQMTQGRYELLRAGSAADRKSLAGLDIDVLDTWNGTRRPVGTLSGGETFLASLALALALARTAERHQGGRRLETVFIDEGFGSLDAETLEYAMATLRTLRDEGRVVGLISHVDEMQRAIPTQLRIIRRGENITTKIVGLPGSCP